MYFLMNCTLFPDGASKGTWIDHPTNGVFGHVPEVVRNQYEIRGGPIRLTAGSYGNRGFGARHIMEKHGQLLIKKGYGVDIDAVIGYVSAIIQPRTPIYCEFDNIACDPRVAVVKSTVGTAILGLRYDQENVPYYMIVTAFDRKQAHGTLIGRTLTL